VILVSFFDFYIMVDWSAAARRRGMRTDTIWIACGDFKAEKPQTESPFSRTEATQLVHSLLDDQANKGLRVLVCFDFAYGYPRDFSAALQAATGTADSTLPWLAVWQYLSDAIKDDEGAVPHGKLPIAAIVLMSQMRSTRSCLRVRKPADRFGVPQLRQLTCIFHNVGLANLFKQPKGF
jgi:hypothetical protein